MERLTERYGIAPDGESDVWVKQHDYISAARKLCDYEDLEEQGLLVRLPIKIGDMVWDNEFRYLGRFIFAGPVYNNALKVRAALLCRACGELPVCVAVMYLTLRIC